MSTIYNYTGVRECRIVGGGVELREQDITVDVVIRRIKFIRGRFVILLILPFCVSVFHAGVLRQLPFGEVAFTKHFPFFMY